MIAAKMYDQLKVQVYEDSVEMGKAAAADFGKKLRALLDKQTEVRLIFAAAPSQNDFLQYLIQQQGIDWQRVVAFHMDEYIGLPPNAKQSFQEFLKEKLFQYLPLKTIHYIDRQAENAAVACRQYEQLLKKAPIDMVALGIGENGHIAFNDPPVANFEDNSLVKIVELDEICRQQQVNDGAFEHIASVPTHAITLTIPALIQGRSLYCIVPGERKTNAVQQTLNGPISTACPASILRKHAHAILYLDRLASGVLLSKN